MQTPFERYWREAVYANPLPTVLELQIERRRPLGIVFLVYCGVIVVADKDRFGGCLDLEPGVACHDCIFTELGLVDHDVHLVLAFAAFNRNFNQQVMVIVPDIGNFDVVSLQFLRDFLTAIDAVLEVTAALDFPAVVDAAASGQACYRCAKNDGGGSSEECTATCQKLKTHAFKIEKAGRKVPATASFW